MSNVDYLNPCWSKGGGSRESGNEDKDTVAVWASPFALGVN